MTHLIFKKTTRIFTPYFVKKYEGETVVGKQPFIPPIMPDKTNGH